MRRALRLQEAVDPRVTVEASETLGLAASILDIGLSVDYYNRFQHAAQLLVAADLAGFSHRSLALLAATIQLAEKEDGSLHGLEPLEPWPLQEPLRRLGQVYELDVRLNLDEAARAA